MADLIPQSPLFFWNTDCLICPSEGTAAHRQPMCPRTNEEEPSCELQSTCWMWVGGRLCFSSFQSPLLPKMAVSGDEGMTCD